MELKRSEVDMDDDSFDDHSTLILDTEFPGRSRTPRHFQGFLEQKIN
jgi:hypothetical protein